MSDPANRTVDPDLANDSGPPTSVAVGATAAGGELRIGQRWRNLVIEGPAPGGAPRTYLAEHLGLMEKVVLRVSPVTAAAEWRRGAWERLAALPDSRVIRCLEAHEESGWRYEISAVPPPMTLREWMSCHRPDFASIESFIRQISAALGALHAQGVVHLDIRPEAIFIDETKSDPVYLLGGWHEATLYTQPELTPSDVDPFYAPPETVGATQHAPGTRLCAWDWWSVGRVLQEFLIGHHVFALVFDRDVSRVTPELRARAERLLREVEPPGVRAGAMEYAIVDSACTPLLRGLLSSACEARWGLDAVQRWLKREQVRDYYDLPQGTRMWSWKGRLFTVAEAAEFFTDEEHWEIGEDMLFHPHDPESLAAFLQKAPAHRADWERLQAVCDLAESTGWEGLPLVARRTVAAAMAWLALSLGAGGRLSFRVRGRVIDQNGLAELLRCGGADAGVALITALLSAPVIQFVETLDAGAARALKSMAEKGGAALRLGLEHGWLDPHDVEAQARLYELSLISGATVRERVDLLRAAYATNSHAALAQWLANKTPEAAELVLLAFTGEAPERHGYITHENWRRQQCAALKARGERIVTQLFWLRLRQTLLASVLWGAPSAVFAGVVLALTAAVGWWTRTFTGPATAAAALLASRVWVWWRVRGMVRTFGAATAGWSWIDGVGRAGVEARKAVGERRMTSGALTHKLHEIRKAIADLSRAGTQRTVIAEPRWWDLWLVMLAAVALAAYPFAAARTRSVATEKPAAAAEVASNDAPAAANGPEAASTPMPEKPLDPAALVATGRYEIVDDGFGRRLRGPLEPWENFAPPHVPVVRVAARAPALPEQSAFALVSASMLLHPYPRKGVNVLLAVRVPTTRGFGVLIYNARDRVLVDREVLLLEQPLGDDSWCQLGARRVLFMGTPLPLDAEISLAPH